MRGFNYTKWITENKHGVNPFERFLEQAQTVPEGKKSKSSNGGGFPHPKDRPTTEDKLDAVGKEDDDINNDGKVDKTDDYLLNKRKNVSKNIKEIVKNAIREIKREDKLIKEQNDACDCCNAWGKVGEMPECCERCVVDSMRRTGHDFNINSFSSIGKKAKSSNGGGFPHPKDRPTTEDVVAGKGKCMRKSTVRDDDYSTWTVGGWVATYWYCWGTKCEKDSDCNEKCWCGQR